MDKLICEAMFDEFKYAIEKEDALCKKLYAKYRGIGEIYPDPDVCRENQMVTLFAAHLRAGKKKYFTQSESNYYIPNNNRRRIDLAVWLMEKRKWIFIEIEPCNPLGGFLGVLRDSKKLLRDKSKDKRDSMRMLIVYGFRKHVKKDGFEKKYNKMSISLIKMGFFKQKKDKIKLTYPGYEYCQVGIWTTN